MGTGTKSSLSKEQLRKYKKRVVSTLFLYLLFFIIACDFKPPEKWETPTWYIDLTIPLINTEYSFEEIINDSIIFADSISDVIQLVFGDTLPPNGIPDSIFNINMETTAMSMPNLGIGSSEPITIPSIPSGSLDISIPMDIDLSALDCFPVNFLQSIDEIPEENGSLSLDFEIDNSIVEVKKVVIVDGLWNMTITNNLPFTITNVDFTISNNSNHLYTTSLLTDIDPYTTKSDPQDITEINPTEIDITYDMLYSALITIDTDHSGEDDVSCPDLDNPPIYICNENPLEFYNFDNTCDSNCDISDCNLIYYCDGNINDAYPNEDCILPNESSETPLIYICGTNIENGYITDYCGGACTEEDCNQIYYCEDNLSGLNLTYIDSNCNTGTDENFVCQNQCIVGSAITCDGECLPGGYVDGWIIDQDISPGLDLSFEYSFNKIGSVIVGLLGIDTTVFSGMPIPGYSGGPG